VLLPPRSGSWPTGLVPGSPVRLGQALATLA